MKMDTYKKDEVHQTHGVLQALQARHLPLRRSVLRG